MSKIIKLSTYRNLRLEKKIIEKLIAEIDLRLMEFSNKITDIQDKLKKK